MLKLIHFVVKKVDFCSEVEIPCGLMLFTIYPNQVKPFGSC